ncbi:cation diffusion facilitator family transporter [Nitratireductor basaltis]|uniref:Zinc transporter ZitB n=1 Tax=Nitratireductor basaltis TaxID=472175 RepID=A0A084U9V6_9HYPH|nr:cation diffusion facilitator family transporter [Nitratireductor basaltis]KFB09742.1 zinc transporter ZitB [Nitratireductor basaltis]
MRDRQDLPEDIVEALNRARRLEWWTIGFIGSIVIVMYFAVGSSQAMKSAWTEDMLSLLPPILFLAATAVERKEPTEFYPYGFHRAGSLGFFASAMALTAMGAYLLFEAVMTLVSREHPSVGSTHLFGYEIWLGWFMMAALLYSVIPPVILGRRKKKLARELRDKILFTDADMNAADWQTGAAGIVGIIGIGLGYWWADAAAAGLISFSILNDGLRNLRTAFAELMDGAPRKIDAAEISETARKIQSRLKKRNPGHRIQIRQTGRYIRAVIVPDAQEAISRENAEALADKDAWQLTEVSRAVSSSADLASTSSNHKR